VLVVDQQYALADLGVDERNAAREPRAEI